MMWFFRTLKRNRMATLMWRTAKVENAGRKLPTRQNVEPGPKMAHGDRNAERLKAIVSTPGTELALECQNLVHECNRLSWGHDEATGMRFSMSGRAWAQDAALACADAPGAVEYAQAIRAAIRDALNGAPLW